MYGTILCSTEVEDRLEWRWTPGKAIEIVDIVVRTDRGKGKGRKMVEDLKVLARQQGALLLFARTRESNIIAQEFYLGIGWRRLGTMEMFYRDVPENAVVYGFDL